MPAPTDPIKRAEWQQKLRERRLAQPDPRKGKKHSEETRARYSATRKGKPLGPPSAEHRAKLSVANKGKTLSEEHRAKLSVANTGKVLSEEHREKIRQSTLGKTQPEEAVRKSAAARTGLKRSEATRARFSALRQGKPQGPRSEEARERMAAAALERRTVYSEEGISSDLFLPGDDEKLCPFCGLIKPISEFFGGGNGKPVPRCRACYTKTYTEARRSRASQQLPGQLSPVEKPLDLIPDGFQQCRTCKIVKPFADFHKMGKGRNGLNPVCKGCRQSTSEDLREKNLVALYGITLEEYNATLEAQGGVCACCGQTETTMRGGKFRPLFVDHCHVTQAVRGLLCSRCNFALGALGENPERIKALLKYVEERCLW